MLVVFWSFNGMQANGRSTTWIREAQCSLGFIGRGFQCHALLFMAGPIFRRSLMNGFTFGTSFHEQALNRPGTVRKGIVFLDSRNCFLHSYSLSPANLVMIWISSLLWAIRRFTSLVYAPM
jgi:hypothetical protein